MTIAEQLRLEGFLKGRQEARLEARLKAHQEGKLEGKLEGRIAGKLEVAENLLRMGMDRAVVLNVTGVNEADLKP
ncbi:hypothetical protein [Rahnella victoriana]|uniref:Transposase n=1 Tax=Rahnella victoriana TaxID=1510570 RepID=A0ABS0DVF3_9GAMM|nr:hypothetical protein [Rahnella victoriana]MBF7957873.1 hypothetical protein [Rahnella victoriana]